MISPLMMEVPASLIRAINEPSEMGPFCIRLFGVDGAEITGLGYEAQYVFPNQDYKLIATWPARGRYRDGCFWLVDSIQVFDPYGELRLTDQANKMRLFECDSLVVEVKLLEGGIPVIEKPERSK